MTKINPITKGLKLDYSRLKQPKLYKQNISTPIKSTALLMGSGAVILSTFLSDYRKTSEEENYFQLGKDKKTGKPYKADVFQKAAAMNLFLGNDVLVTAPTGTGKTAIAKYVITKNLKDGGRTFYTTPLKALSNEKFLDFSKVYGEENVGLLTGDTKINTDAPIVVMTTEVYRNMAASGRFNFDNNTTKGIPENLKTVIFDELQYLGDVDRGGIWEQSIMFTPKNVQMLSLSATIGNNEEINNWMSKVKGRNAALAVTPDNTYHPQKTQKSQTVLINVPSENRHVPLNFIIEPVAAEIKTPRGGSKAQKIKAKKEGARKSQSIYAKPRDEAYKLLTKKLNEENKLPAIYFVFSKRESRHLLKYLSNESELLTTEKEQTEIEEILNKYNADGIYLGEGLDIEALKKGYAIHNSGLLPTQKSLIEELFQKKLVKVVIATETLSAGINMPAKTTVISSPRKPSSTSDGGEDGKRSLTPNEYHQMAGRAGRRGIDTVGYCYSLSCNPEQRKFYEKIIDSPSNRLDSNLDLDFSFIAQYLSEFRNEEELEYILSKSLYTFDNNSNQFDKNKLDQLIDSYNVKKDILKSDNFIDNDYHLTLKGQLIKLLNGYEQIPVINSLTDKVFDRLTLPQLVGLIGGLANIEISTKNDLPHKKEEFRVVKDTNFEANIEVLEDEVGNYSIRTENLHPDKELKFNKKAAEHIYTWAQSNRYRNDSTKVWKDIIKNSQKYGIKDEGSLFKEIVMTVDLLKQLIEVCGYAKKYSETPEDKNYYKNLQESLKLALNLIQREPASDKNI